MKKVIRLTENDIHRIVTNSVKKILTELDWKTYMNAAKKRKEQGNNIRKEINKYFPNSEISTNRNDYDDKADELEKYSQKMFDLQHGKNGEDHNYEGDSPSYMGRNHDGSNLRFNGDDDFEIKNPNHNVWKDDEDGSDVEHRQYRYGKGIPHMEYGEVYDDTLDHYHNKNWLQNTRRKHTMKYNSEGEKYDPYKSSVGDEISISRDKDYNSRQDAMSKDMLNYYTGKSKYTKGKGWE